MSGLFQRLAGRAFGAARVAEPLVPPVFAPVPELNLSPIPETSRPPYAAKSVAAEPKFPTPKQSLPVVSVRAERGVREVSAALEPKAQTAVEKRGVGEMPVPSKARPVDARIHEPGPLSKGARTSTAVSAKSPPPQVTAPVTRHQSLQPEQSGMNFPSRQAAHESPAEPVVRISIGRIDVRAEMGSPAPSPAIRPRQPAMTLQDYARLRAEGKR